jgi:GNAT superfamily N-acetyltransferase
MTALLVRKVQSPADVAAFMTAGKRAQSGNSRWIEPLHDEMRKVFDNQRSPLMLENEIQPFIAFRDGQPAGRIVAVVNRAHLEKYHDACGHFGVIDAIDDRDVFAVLLQHAADFLRARGLRRMRGPFSLSINHEAGLLVKGFDQPHVVRTNHAPPYYGRHIEALGMRKAMDLFAYVCRIAESDFPERVAKTADRFDSAKQIQTYGLALTRWPTEFSRVLRLYNDAWKNNWSSIPVSNAEARLLADLTLPVAKPSWIRIAHWRGEDIAVVSQIPDVNEALVGLGGKLWPSGWARLLWRIHGRGTRMTRIPMIGIASRWRGTRIGSMAVSLLLAEAITKARGAGIEETEISWILETNRAMLNLARSLPAHHTRTFRIYEREL